MGVTWTAQKGADSSHFWLLKEGKEQAMCEPGRKSILGKGNSQYKGPEAGACMVVFKEKQGREGGRSGKRGEW